MVTLLGSSVVTTAEIAPGVRVAAAWSGGRDVCLHLVDEDGNGRVVETWDVWDRWRNKPTISRTLDALELLVETRFPDAQSVEDFIVDNEIEPDDEDDGSLLDLVAASVN